MIEFGKTLRETREAKGLTTSEVAQKTHMLIQHVEALEREDFSKIAAPIYGRGFVKLYCEVLGIDPKPLIQEFMDMYTGNKSPTIRMRKHSSPPPAPPPEPIKPPLDDLPPVPPEMMAAVRNAPPEPVATDTPGIVLGAAPELPVPPEPPAPPPPAPAPVAEPPAPEPTAPAFTLEAEEPPAPPPAPAPAPFSATEAPLGRRPLSTYATPAPSTAHRSPSAPGVPPFVWRVLALAVAAGVVLWLLIAGARMLYRAFMGPEGGEAEPAPAAETAAEPAAAPAAAVPDGQNATDKPAAPAPRTPMKLPPLYIDAER